jgi:hypothetical protein
MTEQKKREILDNLMNGNRSEFRAAIQRMSKLDMLNLIEYSQGQHEYQRHQLINYMRSALEN